jgi:SEC-C motif
MFKVGRNDPCPCGSGKKFKKCCDGKLTEVRPRIQQQTTRPGLKMVLKPGFTQEKTVAYHEAGHAVVAALIGPGTDLTTIDREKVLALSGQPMIGLTNYLGMGKVEVSVDTCLSMALAGVTSEAMYATNGTISAKEDDIVFANEILDNAGFQGGQKELKFLDARIKTEALIKKYEKEIQIVGDALHERKTLKADDIRELLGSNGLSQEELQQR